MRSTWYCSNCSLVFFFFFSSRHLEAHICIRSALPYQGLQGLQGLQSIMKRPPCAEQRRVALSYAVLCCPMLCCAMLWCVCCALSSIQHTPRKQEVDTLFS